MTVTFPDNQNISGRRSGSDRRTFSDPNHTGIERRITHDRRNGGSKRINPRFRVKDLTYVKLRSESKLGIGELLDISRGGLSLFKVVVSEKTNDYFKLGIFTSSGDFAMDQIPFRAVSETRLATGSSFRSISYIRYGIQFEQLTSDQIKELDYFLLNHTLGAA